MDKPNLFKFATSELSQDAVILWLLNWSQDDYKDKNPYLNQCGKEFLDLFTDSSIDKVEKIKLIKQKDFIDIWCEINDDHLLIIEDKTNTKDHDNQLQKYKNNAKRNVENLIINYVYYKTGDITPPEKSRIEGYGYKVVGREKILEILLKYKDKTNSEILEDYYAYLNQIDENEKQVFIKSFDEEISKKKCCQKGFFNFLSYNLDLDKSHKGAYWGKVSNPSGGFIGLWWHSVLCDYCSFYLQFESFNLVLKMKNTSENLSNKAARNKAYKSLCNFTKDKTKIFGKPEHWGNGKTMTLVHINKEQWLVTDSNNVLQKEKVLEKLHILEKWLDDFVEYINHS